MLDDPEKHIPNFVRKYNNLHEFFYKKGIFMLERNFTPTRIALPFIFSRDLVNKEELAIIKMKNKLNNKKYLVLITYFLDFTSSIIVHYFKQIVEEHFVDLIIDDDFMRKL